MYGYKKTYTDRRTDLLSTVALHRGAILGFILGLSLLTHVTLSKADHHRHLAQ